MSGAPSFAGVLALGLARRLGLPDTALLPDDDGATKPRRLEAVPEDAAVAEVFGTFSVVVFVTLIRSKPTENASATICAILVCRPWPISQPPWFSWIDPSV